MQTSEASVLVELDVPVPMRDGVRLRANVYRPPGGRWPVLLTRLPYGKDLPLGTAVLDPVQAARRGYVVIVQDTRGRLASEGDWQPFVNEAADGVDTIAWAAQLPFSDGQVRRFGDDPHALGAAIAALCREIDQLGPNGYASLPLAEFAPLRRQAALPAFFDRIAQPMDPGPLEPLTIAGKHDQVDVPTFNVGGWYDIFLADAIANFQAMHALKRPTKLVIGPWSHTHYQNPIGELNFGFGAQLGFINLQADFGRLQMRWFDHWLKGIDTGMLAEAPIRLFVMGANVWRDEQAWPLERARDTPFYLRTNGEL